MPVFHTKIIEGILEPVAQQVNIYNFYYFKKIFIFLLLYIYIIF